MVALELIIHGRLKELLLFLLLSETEGGGETSKLLHPVHFSLLHDLPPQEFPQQQHLMLKHLP